MSNIVRKPIKLPDDINVQVGNRVLDIKGAKGSLSIALPESITFDKQDALLVPSVAIETRSSTALLGTMRAHIVAAIEGVRNGYTKTLELEGIGYRAQLEGKDLMLSLGFSHPVRVAPPEGIQFSLEKNAISISGIDKQKVGNTAASIRALKKPEPYKGKGIRYRGELIRRKAGKKATGAK